MYDPKKPQHFPPAARLRTLAPTEAEFKEAARKVLAYNWTDEMDDFNKNPDEIHIYHDLRVLHAYLYGGKAAPQN